MEDEVVQEPMGAMLAIFKRLGIVEQDAVLTGNDAMEVARKWLADPYTPCNVMTEFSLLLEYYLTHTAFANMVEGFSGDDEELHAMTVRMKKAERAICDYMNWPRLLVDWKPSLPEPEMGAQ